MLDAGIHVYTTVNVQHLESLHDVVAQITGVVVRETIPDSILEQADEVELIDLPPDDISARGAAPPPCDTVRQTGGRHLGSPGSQRID